MIKEFFTFTLTLCSVGVMGIREIIGFGVELKTEGGSTNFRSLLSPKIAFVYLHRFVGRCATIFDRFSQKLLSRLFMKFTVLPLFVVRVLQFILEVLLT